MTTAATIAARLILDSSDYEKGLKKSEKAADSFASKMEKVGARMQKVGAVMTAAFTVPIAAGIKSSIDLASSYDEALNKVNVVFEDSASVIEDWAEGSAQALGISEGKALAAAGTFGNLFTAQGMGVDAAADMSTAIVQLATDLTSFNDSSPEETLLALRSGLSGEIEPLKRFGVAMNQAMLESKAMEMGLGSNIQALTEAEKVQVRYALIMEQTAKAHGDFARTSDGLANTQRQLAAEWEKSLRILGQNLLPIATKLTTALNEMLQAFTNAPPFVQKGVLAFLALLALAGPLISLIGTVMTFATSLSTLGVSFAGVGAAVSAIGAALAPLLPILALVAAAVFLVWTVWKNWDQLVLIGKALGEAYKKAFQDIGKWAKKAFRDMEKSSSAAMASMSEDLSAWWENTKTGFQKFGQSVSQVWKNIVSGFTSAFRWISNTASNVFRSVASAIAKLIGYIRSLVAAFKSLKVPDVLTPGSPTPFEIGLVGIGDAMQRLNASSIPDMNSALSTAPAAVGQAGAGGRTTYVDNRVFGKDMGADELEVAMDKRFVATLDEALQ
jgi:hypothetical protein